MKDEVDILVDRVTSELGRRQRAKYFHTAEVSQGKTITVLVTVDVAQTPTSHERLSVFLNGKQITGQPT